MWTVIAGLATYGAYLQWQINNISDYLEDQDYDIHIHLNEEDRQD